MNTGLRAVMVATVIALIVGGGSVPVAASASPFNVDALKSSTQFLTWAEVAAIGRRQTPAEIAAITSAATPSNPVQSLFGGGGEIIAAHPYRQLTAYAFGSRCSGSYARSEHAAPGGKKLVYCYQGTGKWTGTRGNYLSLSAGDKPTWVRTYNGAYSEYGQCPKNNTCGTVFSNVNLIEVER